MEIDTFLSTIKKGERVAFTDTMRIIEEHYEYRPVLFTNGPDGDRIVNPAGTNEGSCKIFAFAKLQELTEAETLALFGDYYRHDVIEHPDGDSHANIRTFIRYGWEEIRFSDAALSPRHRPSAR